MRDAWKLLVVVLMGSVAVILPAGESDDASATAIVRERSEPSLQALAEPWFPIGMGLGHRDRQETAVWALLTHHVGQVTIENALKPEPLQKTPGNFTFDRADALVDAALAAGKRVHGHVLAWHRQSPSWMTNDETGKPLPKEQALGHLRDHIQSVMTHYAGRIHSWDVVNEVLRDGGAESEEGDFRASPWYQATGSAYIVEAFRAAAKAQPEALLFYNDYGLETEPKRSRAVRLVQMLRREGVRIDGIGIQAHIRVGHPSLAEIEATIRTFAEMGLLVHISELDVSVLPWRDVGSELLDEDRRFEQGLTRDMAARFNQRYADLFALFTEHHRSLWAVTFWNTHDGRSWLNNFPVKGRVDHPLLFGRDLAPKPAFEAVRAVLDRQP